MTAIVRFLLLVLLLNTIHAQEDEAQEDPAQADQAQADQEAEEDGEGGEECEEAWDYLEFLKTNVKSKIESILQDTMFQPQALLDTVVANTMTQVLEVRDDVLGRTKAIRTGDGEIVICPEQGIKQEEFLSELRMEVMTVLLRLIEPDAASENVLQEVGRALLRIRTLVNGKITQLIMLRDDNIIPRSTDDCDCGILVDVLEGLDEVIKSNDGKDDVEGEDDAEGGAQNGEENPVNRITMVLMIVDARIGVLYNEILAELDESRRVEFSKELKELKEISRSLNEVLIKLTSAFGNDAKIKRIVGRDGVKARNEVDRLVQECRKTCITECNSCGAEQIDAVLDKLQDYNITLVTLDEEDAKESIRADAIGFLTSINEEMNQLLQRKIESENGTLDECDRQKLEVITSIKAPLWMLVNTTIFSDGATVANMVEALTFALLDMRTQYCDSTAVVIQVEENQCDLDEIQTAGDWIVAIDNIISENLFKTTGDVNQQKINAMLGFVEVKSSMDERVRQLFQENLVCKEEVDQIKNQYTDQITRCLAEMMNPGYKFESRSRAERVQCIKSLRVDIEERRGFLLMREIEKKIKQQSTEVEVTVEEVAVVEN